MTDRETSSPETVAAAPAGGFDPISAMRDHPGWMVYFAICAVLGAIGIFYVPFVPESLSMAQKLAGGALVGFYFSLFPIIHRLFD